MRRLSNAKKNVIVKYRKERFKKWIIILLVLQSGHCARRSDWHKISWQRNFVSATRLSQNGKQEKDFLIFHWSIPELLSGEQIINTNRSANILKSNLYVCPICGNIFHSTGPAMISCCGVTLPALEAEQADEEHEIKCEKIEDEFFISIQHPMTKEHYISFVAYCTGERFESVKLYPESSIEVRFFSRGHGTLYWYCNHHGLFKKRI